MKYVIYAHAVSTLILVGLIWTIQIVHYPLFNRVGEAQFRAYEAEHMNRITALVFPLMSIELFTAIVILSNRPPSIHPPYLIASLILIGVIWLSTMLINVPQHNRLIAGFDETTHYALVLSNWIRTIAWTLRGVLVIYFIDRTAGQL